MTLLSNGQYKVRVVILAGIRVNGEIVYTTVAEGNAVIEIGNTRLTLLPAPQDFDGGVEIGTLDKGEQKAEKEKRSKPTSLAQTSVSKRKPSWILFIVIALFGLALPMVGHFVPGFGELLKHTPLPSTTSWNRARSMRRTAFRRRLREVSRAGVPYRARQRLPRLLTRTRRRMPDPAKFNLPQLGNAEVPYCHQDHQGPPSA